MTKRDTLRTIQIEVHLNEEMQAALARSVREFNEILRESSASMLCHGLISQPEDDMTKTEALQSMVMTLLDQEVKKQQLQGSRNELPGSSQEVESDNDNH